jgi:2-C-methyl-D-erythritol 4-phosphate cytidylyltransferase
MSTSEPQNEPPVGEADEHAGPSRGVVPVDGRGTLPFALLHGEPLVAVASWALERADVELVDFTDRWDDVAPAIGCLVLHDPLCPLTPVSFLRSCIDRARADGAVVVGVRPVTDTLKTVSEDGAVGATVDRDELWAVCSPVVLPAAVLARLDDWPETADLARLVERLRERVPVTVLEAPPLARRVADESDLALLEAAADRHPEET